jgi:DNA-binding transcriptional regulator GbsR (MarR family)
MRPEDDYQRLRELFLKVNEDMIRVRGGEAVQGRIYASILLSPQPLTQEDIARETGYSRSHVSRFMKSMEEHSLIVAKTQPGSRKMLYEGRTRSLVDNFRGFFSSSSRFLREKALDIDRILEELTNLPGDQLIQPEYERLQEAVKIYSSFLHAIIEILDEFTESFEQRLKGLTVELT